MKVKELVVYSYFVCREDTYDDKYIYYGFSFKEDADEFIMLDDSRMNYGYQKPRYIYYYVDGDNYWIYLYKDYSSFCHQQNNK